MREKVQMDLHQRKIGKTLQLTRKKIKKSLMDDLKQTVDMHQKDLMIHLHDQCA